MALSANKRCENRCAEDLATYVELQSFFCISKRKFVLQHIFWREILAATHILAAYLSCNKESGGVLLLQHRVWRDTFVVTQMLQVATCQVVTWLARMYAFTYCLYVLDSGGCRPSPHWHADIHLNVLDTSKQSVQSTVGSFFYVT
jgi:hypothetical protein